MWVAPVLSDGILWMCAHIGLILSFALVIIYIQTLVPDISGLF